MRSAHPLPRAPPARRQHAEPGNTSPSGCDTPDYIIKGTDHVELIVIAPKREPLPITQTGYLSHFVIDVSVPNAKDGLAFFLEWIEHEAQKSQKTVSTVFAEPLPTIEASIDESLR